jgi:hypothetical protein
MRGGQLKANNAAMLKTKFQVTQNRLVVLVFCFVDFECTLRSNSSKPTFVCTPGRNKSDSKAKQLPIRLNIFTREWPCGENQEDICNAAANKGEI